MPHRYDLWFDVDGSMYVQLLKLDGYWRVCTSWLIPNTHED